MFRTKAALIAAVVSVAAQAVLVLPSSVAYADPNPAIDQCRALLPSRPASNPGECRSYITVANNDSQGEVAHHCDSMQENDPEIFEMMFSTKSECIQAFGLRGHYN
jgi:hypothetical protein